MKKWRIDEKEKKVTLFFIFIFFIFTDSPKIDFLLRHSEQNLRRNSTHQRFFCLKIEWNGNGSCRLVNCRSKREKKNLKIATSYSKTQKFPKKNVIARFMIWYVTRVSKSPIFPSLPQKREKRKEKHLNSDQKKICVFGYLVLKCFLFLELKSCANAFYIVRDYQIWNKFTIFKIKKNK